MAFLSRENGPEGDLEALASRRAEVLPGDYIQDGLLHCGACHSRKETFVELFGLQRKVACLCRCQSEKVQRQLEEMEARQRIEALERKRAEIGRAHV